MRPPAPLASNAAHSELPQRTHLEPPKAPAKMQAKQIGRFTSTPSTTRNILFGFAGWSHKEHINAVICLHSLSLHRGRTGYTDTPTMHTGYAANAALVRDPIL